MTQNANDVEIANQGFAAFRQDLNDVLEDIATLHSGDDAPTTTYANQWWYETDTNKLYIRNEDNDAWIEILTIDQANDHLATIGASITLDGTGNVSIDSGDFTVDTDTLYVDASADAVGINDSAPSCVLTIQSSNTTTDSGLIRHAASQSPTSYYSLMGTRYEFNKSFVINNKGNEILTYSDGTTFGLGLDGGAGNVIRFTTNASERMRIQSGGGISFNGDTAAANALDDYEEGNWTPTFGRTGTAFTTTPTYTFRTSRYIKVGNLVHATCNVRFSTTGFSGGSGNFKIDGLPFSASSYLQGISFGIMSIFTNNIDFDHGNYVSGTTVQFSGNNVIASNTSLKYLTFTVQYEAS